MQTANLTKEENLSNGKVTNFRMLFKILIEQSPSDKTRIKENLSKSKEIPNLEGKLKINLNLRLLTRRKDRIRKIKPAVMAEKY